MHTQWQRQWQWHIQWQSSDWGNRYSDSGSDSQCQRKWQRQWPDRIRVTSVTKWFVVLRITVTNAPDAHERARAGVCVCVLYFVFIMIYLVSILYSCTKGLKLAVCCKTSFRLLHIDRAASQASLRVNSLMLQSILCVVVTSCMLETCSQLAGEEGGKTSSNASRGILKPKCSCLSPLSRHAVTRYV